MMAEAGMVAHTRKTLRAHRVQIAFVEREVGAAKSATGGPTLARRSARRAADHRRLVPLVLSHDYGRAAVATKLRAWLTFGRIELSVTVRTGNQNTHGAPLYAMRSVGKGIGNIR
jgi:hypothetical protein